MLASSNEAYTYDGLDQLTGFTRNTTTRAQSYDYDAVGNFEGQTTNGSTQTRTHNRQNEILTVSGATSPTFDANGNMTKDETGKQYSYDAWNRLKVVKDAGGTTLVSYNYDAENQRVQEVTASTRDLYYSDEWQVLEERVGGVTRVSYVWSPVYVDAMIARDRDADNNGSLEERLYPTHDANFNVSGLVNVTGVIVERYAYDPFGTVTIQNASGTTIAASSVGWQYLHQGGRLDAASGLYSFRNREYSPTLGRWVTMDPIRYAAGDVNLYRAIGNNCVNAVDPQGLSWLSDAYDAVNFPGALYDYAKSSYNIIGADKPISAPVRDVTDATTRDQLPTAGTGGRVSVGDNRRNVADSVKGAGAFVVTVAAAAAIDQVTTRGGGKFRPNNIATPTVKGAGKIADVVPKFVPKNWSRIDIEEAILVYERSIVVRRAEQAAHDAAGTGTAVGRGSHFVRIAQEENFLSQLRRGLE